MLVEYCGLTILVDAGPDFRFQMLRADVRHIDAILLTHNHKDHTGGLDDIRAFNLIERHPVNIYCQKYVEDTLRLEYDYAFAEHKYPGAPEWRVHTIDASKPITVHSNANEEVLVWERGFGYHHLAPESAPDATAEVIPIQGWHLSDRTLSVLGYRFGNIAYLTDIKHIDDSEYEKLKGLDYIPLPPLAAAVPRLLREGRRPRVLHHPSLAPASEIRGFLQDSPSARASRLRRARSRIAPETPAAPCLPARRRNRRDCLPAYRGCTVIFKPCSYLQHHLHQLSDEFRVVGPGNADVVARIAFHEAAPVGGFEQHLLADTSVGLDEFSVQAGA